MPQLSVSYGAIIAQPGMAFDAEMSNRDVVSVVASENIPFGSFCELRSGYASLAYPLQDSGTTTSFNPESIGIAMFDPLGVEQSYVPFAVPNSGAGSSAAGWRSISACRSPPLATPRTTRWSSKAAFRSRWRR